MKLDLLTNASVVDDAIRFVSSQNQKSKDKDKKEEDIKSSLGNNNEEDDDEKEESNKCDYNEESKMKTINQIF